MAAVIQSTLDSDAQAALRGAIESRLPFTLEGCVLVHAGWLYDVGRLEPGGRFEPASGRGPRSLAGALTRRAAAKERDVAERWDTSSTDVDVNPRSEIRAAAASRIWLRRSDILQV